MRFRRTLALLTALIGAALIAALPTTAAPTAYRYDTAQRVINACVLAVDVDRNGTYEGALELPNPYVMEGLRRSDLTPDDWVFENPLAPGTVVPARAPHDTIVKGNAAYWVVELSDANAKRLVGMDLVYLSASELDLTPREWDGLRAAVEAGALLWIDNIADPADPAAVTNIVSFPWDIEFGYNGAGNFALDAVDPGHELLRNPHALSRSAITRLGDRPDRDEYDQWQSGEPDSTFTEGYYLSILGPEFRTIIENTDYDTDVSYPWAAVAEYGSGNVLVTTGGVGREVTEWLLEGIPPRRPSPNFLQAPDVSFVLNAVQWNSDRWQQARGTPRASATSVARAPFPLDVAWQYPERSDTDTIGAVVSTPVHGRNILYALSLPTSDASLPGYLMAFDMIPDQQWAVGGRPYAPLWRVPVPDGVTTHYSSPTVASTPDPDYPQVVLVSYANPDTGEAWVDCRDGSINGNGDRLWRREIPGYVGLGVSGAEVIALSTPVVHNGYVYVLSSEYDAALGANEVNSTYGRVHCFELDYDWGIGDDPWATDASWWVYPSDRLDLDNNGSAQTEPEPQRSLPPFHDPHWVAADTTLYSTGRTDLPPAPGAIPVVHAAGTAADGAGVDALVTFGTPVSYHLVGGNIRINNSVGGSQYTLVPTPFRGSDSSYGLNADYFGMQMNEEITAWISTRTQMGNANVDQEFFPTDPGSRYGYHSPGAAREAVMEAIASGADELKAQLGVDVNVLYSGLPDPEAHTLPGPVRWKRVLDRGQPINQPGAMGADAIAVSSGRPINYAHLTPPPPVPGGSGVISEMDAATGATRWSYDPSRAMPGRSADAQGESTTAAAFDAETIIVGASAVDYVGTDPSAVSSIIGLNRQMDVQVELLRAGEYPVAVHTAWWRRSTDTWEYPELAPNSYAVDPWAGRIRFSAESAADPVGMDGAAIGVSIYGRVLRVEWADGTLEDHIVPEIERFHHTQNFIRLRHFPVVDGSVTMERPDGTAIDLSTLAWVSDAQDFGYPDLAAPRDVRSANLDGWIDLSSAADVDGVLVRPGDELLVSYTGWWEAEGGWRLIPSPGFNLAVERHQKPVEFGPSLSSPAVAGDTIHLGTQGRDADMNAVFEGAPDAKTMLSLIWNKATGFVRSGKTQPAYPQAAFSDTVPVVSGAPSVIEDRVFVGSRMMSKPDLLGVGPGYVSALAPWRVLLCDSNRIVETTGAEPSWVCTGTSSPQRTQDYIGEDMQRPFSRPAKASRLETGNILVVDSGNQRVVEVDRAGRMTWPLDVNGYEYYTSPRNNNLKLSRPADAHRYYELETGPVTGRRFPVLHTVIADTGNARVIDIETRFYDPVTEIQDGRQRHDVKVLTPTHVRGARGPQRVRYTSAIPLRDPVGDALIGYLCAASNLNQLLIVTSGANPIVNPFAGVTIPNTSGTTWAYWAWLYDPDPTDGNNVSSRPLQFENIKHVDLQRIGDTIHVAVTASRYTGRSDAGVHAIAAEGAGVFEFRIDVSSADPADWALDEMGAGVPWPTEEPHWRFTHADYVADAMTTITTDAGTYQNRWYPVCAQRLSDDTVLLTNSLSQIENATHENIGAGVRESVIGSHIFEVQTEGGVHLPLDRDRSVPAPGRMWIDPFTQPAHAEISR